jgi:hypothetical protein
MKIMNNFDTKLDETELLSAINEQGKGSAILTKKHRFFLMKPLLRMIFALIVFGGVLWFVYHQFFSEYLLVFIIVCSAYGAITLFRIVHTLVVIYQCIKNNKIFADNIDEQDLKS